MPNATTPLTLSQKARLATACLPFPFFVAAVAFYYVFWVDFASAVTHQPIEVRSNKGLLFMGFMAIVLAITGRSALLALRDLSCGVARVTEDRVVRFWGRGRFKGATFEKLGRMRVIRRTGNPGSQQRVVYSPASKIVWFTEPV
jgi:hypothetical protein